MRERTTSAATSNEMVQEGTPDEEELGAYQRDGFSLGRETSVRERGRSCPSVACLVADQLHDPQTC